MQKPFINRFKIANYTIILLFIVIQIENYYRDLGDLINLQ